MMLALHQLNLVQEGMVDFKAPVHHTCLAIIAILINFSWLNLYCWFDTVLLH